MEFRDVKLSVLKLSESIPNHSDFKPVMAEALKYGAVRLSRIYILIMWKCIFRSLSCIMFWDNELMKYMERVILLFNCIYCFWVEFVVYLCV